ncbi:MAG TPA: hypothetical protein VGH14_20315 [Solirubrobacterales bacterium]|jgi:hypothetical protein
MRLLQALRELRRSERGVALPVAITVTFVGLGLAAVPVLASINTQHGDSRSQGSNQALAAAEAGANIALLRQSQMIASTSSTKPCVGLNGVKLEAQAMLTSGTESTWCSSVAMTSTSSPAPPSGTEVIYHAMPCFHQTGANSACTGLVSCATGKSYAESPKENFVKVVSEGKATVGGEKVTQRVAVVGCSENFEESKEAPPAEVFEGGEVVGIESLYFSGNSKVYYGGAASNGTVQIIDSSKICGGLRYGPGTLAPVGREEQVENVKIVSERPYSNGTRGGVCIGELPTQGTTEYPNVTAPTGIATNNSDSRLTKMEDKGNSSCGHEYCNISWNASNRSLTINYDRLTLAGTLPYFLCSLEVTGGTELLAAPGAKIRIFFDEPKNCPGLNGANQLTINGGATIGADSANGPGFYFLGAAKGEKPESKIYFGNGAASANLVIYAPRSEVWVAGGINLNGAILGRTMKIQGGANINPNKRYVTPPSSEYLAGTKTTVTKKEPYVRQSYVQCTSSGTLGSGC